MNPGRSIPAVIILLATLGSAAANAGISVDTGFTFHEIERFLGPTESRSPAGKAHWIELMVDCDERVKAGQKLAVQKNAAGEIVQEYTAGSSGRVQVIARGVQGAPILEIHTLPDNTACADGNCTQVSAH